MLPLLNRLDYLYELQGGTTCGPATIAHILRIYYLHDVELANHGANGTKPSSRYTEHGEACWRFTGWDSEYEAVVVLRSHLSCCEKAGCGRVDLWLAARQHIYEARFLELRKA